MLKDVFKTEKNLKQIKSLPQPYSRGGWTGCSPLVTALNNNIFGNDSVLWAVATGPLGTCPYLWVFKIQLVKIPKLNISLRNIIRPLR